MSPNDGFKKAPAKPLCMSVREAVSLHGDGWRLYVGKQYTIGSDLVTFDGIEKLSMWLMERGISPRVRAGDLA